MIPANSVWMWPDGKTFTCHVWFQPEKAKCYIITKEMAEAVYPNRSLDEAVRMLAMDRFCRSTD